MQHRDDTGGVVDVFDVVDDTCGLHHVELCVDVDVVVVFDIVAFKYM